MQGTNNIREKLDLVKVFRNVTVSIINWQEVEAFLESCQTIMMELTVNGFYPLNTLSANPTFCAVGVKGFKRY